MVDFTDTPEQAEFRAMVRDFIEDTATVAERPGDDPLMERAGSDSEGVTLRWRKALAERGWLGPHWPKEYGGLGLTVTEQFILNQELAGRVGGISGLLGIAVMMFGPTLILTGSEEQKQQHLPKILTDEFEWCQGWSEPSAGSDLASLQ
ncbi:MAG: acyl-CoA dehydrogenase, partial [Chloroflexi bacterium]|nr:acyl-CoA dehydrogenase [Chloroflexota bacterium]